MNPSKPIECRLCETYSITHIDIITHLCDKCTISEEYNQHERQIHEV